MLGTLVRTLSQTQLRPFRCVCATLPARVAVIAANDAALFFFPEDSDESKKNRKTDSDNPA